MLATALWSLSQQTLQDFELVFVGARPQDVEFVQEFCRERNILCNLVYEPNMPNRAARFQYGTNVCRGHWIAVLDSDDLLHPDALWTVYRCLKRFPIFNFFSGSHVVFDESKRAVGKEMAAPLGQTIQSLTHTFRQRHFWGFVNDDCRWPPGMFAHQYDVEDYWLFATLAMNGVPVLGIPHVLYAWRRWHGQWTQFEKQKCQFMCADIQRRLTEFSKKQSPMWHWGDMALAARLNAHIVAMEKEIAIGEDG